MSQQYSQTLEQVAETTFESLAFMFSVADDEPGEEREEAVVAASLEFFGPCSGCFVVVVSENLLRALAANMLGIDEDEATNELQQDALKELANVICGNVLPAIAGERALFNVHPPHFVYGRFEYNGEPTACAKLSLDEGLAEVYLFIDDELPTECATAETAGSAAGE